MQLTPIRPQAQTHRDDTPEVRPGSWWRLAAADHPLRAHPAPDHGIILMVSEARVIDAELHTVVLHPHPLWQAVGQRPILKMLAADFLRDFTPEPQGETLRAAELDAVMGRVAAISDEMRSPPEPMLLLAAQAEKQTDKAQGADQAQAPDSGEASGLPGGTQVPAALLPSQDIVEAQRAIETRIAAFEAQKTWITSKTDELKGEMNLVSLYQQEKVNTTLASISQETGRAQKLLENVQTMRLFLGEDMEVTRLLEGEGADPAEPLTFMQRMLYLDEEIFVQDLLEGFSDDQMHPEDLADLFSRDFGLVERMLPHPRSVVITRVRREAREFGSGQMTISQLFEKIAQDAADKRIHIFVRDGARLSMITADEITSGAQRLFPSRVEIDALFKTRAYFGEESREITPDQVDYSDARADHDKRALFYKRFLILLWGAHERTNVFGPFLAKGANWLAATTHSERFRFVHDEEEVLEDGRPEIAAYVAAANSKLVAGSRVVVRWGLAIQPETAPTICETDRNYHRVMKNAEWTEEISDRMVEADGAKLIVKAPCARWRGTPFNAKVALSLPARQQRGRPDSVVKRDLTDGFLCLDHLERADLDYYIASRKARRDYARFLHLVNAARAALIADEAQALRLKAEIEETGISFSSDASFLRALRAWRRGNKWQWPQKPAQFATLRTLATHLDNPQTVTAFLSGIPGLMRGGVTTRGEIYALSDTAGHSLSDGTPLPWLVRQIFSGPGARTAKKEELCDWQEQDAADEIPLLRDDAATQAFLDRVAPPLSIEVGGIRERKTITVPGWRTPRGLLSAGNCAALGLIRSDSPAASRLSKILDGTPGHELLDWLDETYERHETDRASRVTLGRMSGHLALATAVSDEVRPHSWLIGYEVHADVLAWHLGYEDAVRKAVRGLYAKPDRVIERIAQQGPGISLTIEAMGLTRDLKTRMRKDIFLSFEDGRETIDLRRALPEDARDFGWRGVIAALITQADVELPRPFGGKTHSRSALEGPAARINVEGTPAALELCDRILALNA